MPRHIKRWLPIIVSLLALFCALGGTGYAGANPVRTLPRSAAGRGGLTTRQVRLLIAAYLRAHRITSGPQGPAGPAGPQGATGAAGAPGPQGPAGAAAAYTHVVTITSDTAAIDSFDSKGIGPSNFTNPSPGQFCFSGLGFDPKNALATLDVDGGSRAMAVFATLGAAVGCPTGTQITVVTLDMSGSDAEYGFFLAAN